MNKRKDATAADPTRQIGEALVAGTTYPIRAGLAATVSGVVGLAEGYAVQKAWYDAVGRPEPAVVRARRRAAGEPAAKTKRRENA